MKKLLVALMLVSFSMATVAEVNHSPIDHVSKFEVKKQDVQSFEITAYHLDAVVPAVIVVTEPVCMKAPIDYIYVAPVTDMPFIPQSRCNDPPAGINT